jgi:hypothetical protein
MKKTVLKAVILTFYDYCGRELTPPHAVIKRNDGRMLDLCDDYQEGKKSCRQKYDEICKIGGK